MLLASHIEGVTPVRSTYVDATYAAIDYLDKMKKVLDCSELKNESNQEYRSYQISPGHQRSAVSACHLAW